MGNNVQKKVPQQKKCTTESNDLNAFNEKFAGHILHNSVQYNVFSGAKSENASA